MSNYTPEMTAEMVLKGSFTYAEAVEFANEHGLKARSVISKVKSLGLPYEPKPARVNKRNEPIVLKEQFVASIQAATGVVVPSLVRMTKADLARLCEAVGAETPEPR